MLRSKGFTLLELAVVMMILAVTIGMFAPYISSDLFSFNTKKKDFHRLLAAIDQARTMAVVGGKQVNLIFYLGENQDCLAVSTNSSQSFKDLNSKNFDYCFKSDLDIVDIYKKDKEPLESGLVSLKFMPPGIAEQAIIHLMLDEDEKSIFIRLFLKEIIKDGNLSFTDVGGHDF